MELPNLGGPSGLARLGCQVLPAGDMHSGELHVDPGSGRKLGPYRDQTLTPMPICADRQHLSGGAPPLRRIASPPQASSTQCRVFHSSSSSRRHHLSSEAITTSFPHPQTKNHRPRYDTTTRLSALDEPHRSHGEHGKVHGRSSGRPGCLHAAAALVPGREQLCSRRCPPLWRCPAEQRGRGPR